MTRTRLWIPALTALTVVVMSATVSMHGPRLPSEVRSRWTVVSPRFPLRQIELDKPYGSDGERLDWRAFRILSDGDELCLFRRSPLAWRVRRWLGVPKLLARYRLETLDGGEAGGPIGGESWSVYRRVEPES